MDVFTADPILTEKLIAERRATGADRYDEVWEGIYVMAPMANDEHQKLVTEIASVLYFSITRLGQGEVRAGVNVTDREDDWTQNLRCSDVAVFLDGAQAENRDTHWFGGPDFAVEIISPHDKSREKLDFYAKVGTRELLLVDRDPWALELYRLEHGKLNLVGRSTTGDPNALASQVVPFTWRLVAGSQRPQIHAAHSDGKQQWTI